MMMLTAAVAVAGQLAGQDATGVVLGDLASASRIEIRDSSGAPVLSGTFEQPAGMVDDDDRDARLTGEGDARGEVDIDLDDDDQDIEVEVRGLEANQSYSVWIDGRQVGSFTTDGRGRAEVEWEGPRAH